MGNKKPIVFILSAARSGSTLLKYMLGRHPSIFAPSELHLLPFNTFVDAKKQLDGTLLSQGLFEAIKKLDNGDANKANDQVDCFIKNKTPVLGIEGTVALFSITAGTCLKTMSLSGEQMSNGISHAHLKKPEVIDSFMSSLLAIGVCPDYAKQALNRFIGNRIVAKNVPAVHPTLNRLVCTACLQ